MANSITINSVTEELYANMAATPRELTGFLDTVTRNVSGVTQASFGSYVKSVTGGGVTVHTDDTYTPTMTIPQAADLTYGADSFALNKYVWASIPLMGEPERKMDNTYGSSNAFALTMEDLWRQLRNNAEGVIFDAVKIASSRATGTAGATPFATNYNELVDARKILVDNGTGLGDWYVVCDTAAGANLRKYSGLQRVNEAGTNAIQQGSLIPLVGFNLRESNAVTQFTSGAATGYVTDTLATYAVGATTIHVDTGTAVVKPGDVVTFNGDSNKYVVITGTEGEGDITISAPGLRKALANDVAMSVEASYTPNMAFARSAIEVAYRAPIMPDGGDAAKVSRVMSDPVTGITMRASIYGGRGINNLILETFMGVKVWNTFKVATILG